MFKHLKSKDGTSFIHLGTSHKKPVSASSHAMLLKSLNTSTYKEDSETMEDLK